MVLNWEDPGEDFFFLYKEMMKDISLEFEEFNLMLDLASKAKRRVL